MIVYFPSGKSAIQVSDIMSSTCKCKDISTKFMDNWRNGRIVPIIFPLHTSSYVFKVTLVGSAKHFKERGW